MRRFVAIVCALVMVFGAACAERLSGEAFLSDETVFSGALAQDALALSMFSTAAEAREALNAEGFEVLHQMYYDKPVTDLSDTCAYTIAKKQITVGGEKRVLLFVSVRGTGAGEWYSNFDIASPEDTSPLYAKGFYLSAVDVMENFAPLYESEGEPLTLVTGYSRGAACANLVGVLMDDRYGGDGVYVYSFATPRTVRGDFAGAPYDNIFNIVSEVDAVPRVPFSAWGFSRAGQDIVLRGSEGDVKRLERALDSLLALAPTIDQYYNQRHSLSGPGEAEDGMSAFEFIIDLVNGLSGGSGNMLGKLMDLIKFRTDFTPVLTLLLTLTMNDMALLKNVLMRHMPDAYAALLSEYIAQMP